MTAVQARLGQPRPERRETSVSCAGSSCLGLGWSLLRGGRGGGVETTSRLRQPLRAPGAHTAGQKERRPALVLEFSVHLIGASWSKAGRAYHVSHSTHIHTCCCGDPGNPRVPSALPPPQQWREGSPRAGPYANKWARTWEPAH